jgi:hypothetical protein
MRNSNSRQSAVFTIGVIVTLAITFAACRKQFVSNGQAPEKMKQVATAYMDKLVTSEKSLLDLPYNQLGKNANLRIFSRFQKLNENLDWSRATGGSKNGIDYMVVPVDEPSQPFKNKNVWASRSLVFYQNKEGDSQVFIVEALSNQNIAFESKMIDISKAAFEKKLFGLATAPADVNVTVILYDRFYYSKASYQFTNGNITVANVKLQNQLQPNSKMTVSVNTVSRRLKTIGLTSCTVCTTWYLVEYWYSPTTGEIYNAVNLDQWDVCISTGGGYGDGPGGSGGSAGTQNAISMRNELKNPCLNAVLSTMTSSVTGVVKTLFDNIGAFPTTIKYNTSTTPYANPNQLGDGAGYYDFATSSYTINVNLYDAGFAGMSQEYMAAAMMHEALHGVMDLQGGGMSTLDQHPEMANQYRMVIENALVDKFGLTQEDAEALSWEGLDSQATGSAWAQLGTTKQLQIIGIVNKYRSPSTSNVGTSC